MRSALAEAGLPQPPYARLRSPTTSPRRSTQSGFPAVLKPVDSGGQRAVFRIESREELERDLARGDCRVADERGHPRGVRRRGRDERDRHRPQRRAGAGDALGPAAATGNRLRRRLDARAIHRRSTANSCASPSRWRSSRFALSAFETRSPSRSSSRRPTAASPSWRLQLASRRADGRSRPPRSRRRPRRGRAAPGARRRGARRRRAASLLAAARDSLLHGAARPASRPARFSGSGASIRCWRQTASCRRIRTSRSVRRSGPCAETAIAADT